MDLVAAEVRNPVVLVDTEPGRQKRPLSEDGRLTATHPCASEDSSVWE